MRKASLRWIGLVLVIAVAGLSLAWGVARTQHPTRTSTTLVAMVAGFPNIDPWGGSCRATDKRTGLGGWRRGALCLRRNGHRLGMASRGANGHNNASAQWYQLQPTSIAFLVDSIRSAMETRGATAFQLTGKCPGLIPTNVRERGAWQGEGFQAVLSEFWDHDWGHKLQLSVTSSSFSFCGPVDQ